MPKYNELIPEEGVRIPLAAVRKWPQGASPMALRWAEESELDEKTETFVTKLVQAVVLIWTDRGAGFSVVRRAFFGLESGDYLGDA